jgi:Fungal cellulose binding domain
MTASQVAEAYEAFGAPGPCFGQTRGGFDHTLKCVNKKCVKKTPVSRFAKRWGRCGGRGYKGPPKCPRGFRCKRWGTNFSQCVPARKPGGQKLWGQCGGEGWKGLRTCASGGKCVLVNKWYSQCQPKK